MKITAEMNDAKQYKWNLIEGDFELERYPSRHLYVYPGVNNSTFKISLMYNRQRIDIGCYNGHLVNEHLYRGISKSKSVDDAIKLLEEEYEFRLSQLRRARTRGTFGESVEIK